jgi:hypothetical protein
MILEPLALSPAPKPASGDLDQTRNGTEANPIDPPDWVNGNAGASNAHYQEGQSIPYRLRLDNLATTGSHTVVIEWDTRHSSVNAIDYITYYDRIGETVNPLLGLSGNYVPSAPIQIPTPGLTNGATTATNSFMALSAPEQKFTVYNAQNVVLSYVLEAPLTGAQTATSLQISFTATAPNVLFAWGGHIASRGDWGLGNSASGISGSPYHTRLLSVDGSGGNQDRSLSAAAVSAPNGCSLTGPATVCENAPTLAHYTPVTTVATSTYAWSITGNGTISASNGIPGNGPVYADVQPGASGSYTISAVESNAGGSAPACTLIVTVNASTVINTPPSPAEVCEGSIGPANFSVSASGTNLQYAWKVNGVAAGSNSPNLAYNPSGLADGNYTVRVDVTGDCGSTFAETTLTVKTATAIVSPPVAATACEGSPGPVNFSVTAEGVSLHYAWQVNGAAAGGDSSSLAYNPSALADGVYTVRVDVTGQCGSTFAQTTLTINDATAITTGPAAQTACDDSHGPLNFSVVAHGSGTLTYAWKVDGTPAGTNSSSLSYDPFTLGPGPHTVRVDVSGSCGSVFAQTTLTINANPVVNITLEQACAGTAHLNAGVTGGTGTIHYSWKKDNVPLGIDSANLPLTGPGTYSVSVTDSATPSCGSNTDTFVVCYTEGSAASASPQGSPDSLNAAIKPKSDTSTFFEGLATLVVSTLGMVIL